MPPKRKTAKSATTKTNAAVKESPKKNSSTTDSIKNEETKSLKRKHEEEEEEEEDIEQDQDESPVEEPTKATSSLSDKMAKLKELKRRRVCIRGNTYEIWKHIRLFSFLYLNRQLKLNKAIVAIVILSFNVAKITQSSKQETREKRLKH